MTPFVLTGLIESALFLGAVTIAMLVYVSMQYKSANALGFMAITNGVWCSRYLAVHKYRKLGDYFDADLFLSDPNSIEFVVNWFKTELRTAQLQVGPIDHLVFIEKREGPVGAITLKDLLSWVTKVPSIVIRLRRQGPAFRIKLKHDQLSERTTGWQGPMKRVLESNKRPYRVALVSDVLTTGGTVADALRMVKDAGGETSVVFVLYDREEPALTDKGESVTVSEQLRIDRQIKVVTMITRHQMEAMVTEPGYLKEAAKKKGVDKLFDTTAAHHNN